MGRANYLKRVKGLRRDLIRQAQSLIDGSDPWLPMTDHESGELVGYVAVIGTLEETFRLKRTRAIDYLSWKSRECYADSF